MVEQAASNETKLKFEHLKLVAMKNYEFILIYLVQKINPLALNQVAWQTDLQIYRSKMSITSCEGRIFDGMQSENTSVRYPGPKSLAKITKEERKH